MRIDRSELRFKHEDDTVMQEGVSPYEDSLPEQNHFMDEYQLFLTSQPAAAQFWPSNPGISEQFGFEPSPEQYLADPSLSPYVHYFHIAP